MERRKTSKSHFSERWANSYLQVVGTAQSSFRPVRRLQSKGWTKNLGGHLPENGFCQRWRCPAGVCAARRPACFQENESDSVFVANPRQIETGA